MATWSYGLSQTDIKRITSLKKKSLSNLNDKLRIIKKQKELLFERSVTQHRAGNISNSRATDRRITSLANSEFQIENAIKLKRSNK